MKVRNIFGVLWIAFFSWQTAQGQAFQSEAPFAHTYSIVAYDENTGEMGVAVQSHWFQVGPAVAWGEAGVGVVATQSFANPAYGQEGLKLMKAGKSPKKALEKLLAEDEGKEVRQVAMLNKNGAVAAHTGSKCIAAAGHIEGVHYSVQANLMLSDMIWPAMAEAFEKSKGQALEDRMMAALIAAQRLGGDIRGRQSAAMLIVKGESTGMPWVDRRVDIRIADHPNPLKEMERLLTIRKGYHEMNLGEKAMENKNLKAAKAHYEKALSLQPENAEMKFWYAVSLLNNGQLEEAKSMFKQSFAGGEQWRILIPRVVDAGLLTIDEKGMLELMKL